VLWWLAAPGTIFFAGRLLLEETLLTWRRGPQLVGFALGHGSFLVVAIAYGSLALAHVWLLLSLPLLATKIWRSVRVTRRDWIRLGTLAAATTVFYVPYTLWILLMVLSWGPGPHGPDFLVWGATSGDERLVGALLARGIDLNTRDSGGRTVLHGACAMRQNHMVDWLVRRGADVNARERVLGETPLMSAAGTGEAGIVSTLLLNGADPDLVDNNGNTALAYAKRYGQQEVVPLLERVTKPANINR